MSELFISFSSSSRDKPLSVASHVVTAAWRSSTEPLILASCSSSCTANSGFVYYFFCALWIWLASIWIKIHGSRLKLRKTVIIFRRMNQFIAAREQKLQETWAPSRVDVRDRVSSCGVRAWRRPLLRVSVIIKNTHKMYSSVYTQNMSEDIHKRVYILGERICSESRLNSSPTTQRQLIWRVKSRDANIL